MNKQTATLISDSLASLRLRVDNIWKEYLLKQYIQKKTIVKWKLIHLERKNLLFFLIPSYGFTIDNATLHRIFNRIFQTCQNIGIFTGVIFLISTVYRCFGNVGRFHTVHVNGRKMYLSSFTVIFPFTREFQIFKPKYNIEELKMQKPNECLYFL